MGRRPGGGLGTPGARGASWNRRRIPRNRPIPGAFSWSVDRGRETSHERGIIGPSPQWFEVGVARHRSRWESGLQGVLELLHRAVERSWVARLPGIDRQGAGGVVVTARRRGLEE